jgi:hypothetical protein
MSRDPRPQWNRTETTGRLYTAMKKRVEAIGREVRALTIRIRALERKR